MSDDPEFPNSRWRLVPHRRTGGFFLLAAMAGTAVGMLLSWAF